MTLLRRLRYHAEISPESVALALQGVVYVWT